MRWTYGKQLSIMQAKIGNALLPKLKPGPKPYEVNDTELKGFLLRVQPSGVVSYYCTYRNRDGKRNRISLGRHPTITPAQARDHARQVLASVVHGEDPALRKKVVKVHTLKTFIDDDYALWVNTHRKDGKATVARLFSCFPEFHQTKLAEITPLSVERWRTRRTADGKKPATINRDLAALKSALSKAIEWGVIENHPLEKVKPSKLDHNAVVRFLSDDEESRLRKALDAREERLRSERDNANRWRSERAYPKLPDLTKLPFVDHLKPMVLVSINTGLRQGELFHLAWSNVDLDRAILTVSGDNAKSGKTRHLPINDDALGALKLWRNQQANTMALVFPSVNGQPFDNVTRAWHGVLEDADINSFRWHDMRHHFASRLVMAGVDLNTVRELLGHADIKMTLRYAHLAPEHKAAAVAKLVRILDKK